MNVSVLQFKRSEFEENEIVTEELSLLPGRGPAVQGYFSGKSAEPLLLFRNKAGEQVF